MLKKGMIIKHHSFDIGIVQEVLDNYAKIYFPNLDVSRQFILNIIQKGYAKKVDDLNLKNVFTLNLLNGMIDQKNIKKSKRFIEKDLVNIEVNEENKIQATVEDNEVHNVRISLNGDRVETSCTCDKKEYCEHVYAAYLKVKNQNKDDEEAFESLIEQCLFDLYSISYFENLFKIINKANSLSDLSEFYNALESKRNRYNETNIIIIIKILLLNSSFYEKSYQVSPDKLPTFINLFLIKNKDIIIKKVNYKELNTIFAYSLMNGKVEEFLSMLNNYYKRLNNELKNLFFAVLRFHDLTLEEYRVLSTVLKYFENRDYKVIYNYTKNKEVKKMFILNGNFSLDKKDIEIFNDEELKDFFLNYRYNNIYDLFKSVHNKLKRNLSDLELVQIYYKMYYQVNTSQRYRIIKELSIIDGSEYVVEYLENNSYESRAYYGNSRYFY